ncbi:hypothetical protein ACLB2K_037445 [Fragaria x ananassa]
MSSPSLKCGRPSVSHRPTTTHFHPGGLQQRPPITFPPRRVRRILVFRRIRSCLKFWAISQENWNSADSQGRESDWGRCWSPLGWRRAVVGAGRCPRITDHDWDYRWMEYPAHLRTSKHPSDQSLATYRDHSVLRTLIRCYFSPAYSTGQKYIYTGSSDHVVYIYDLVTGAQVAKLVHHDGPVRDCSWHPTYPMLVSSSWDGSIARWEFPGDDQVPTVVKPRKPNLSTHPLGSLIKGCLNFIEAMRVNHISHIFREVNVTVDALAKYSVDHDMGLVIFDKPPHHVANAFIDDFTSVTRDRRVSCSKS